MFPMKKAVPCMLHIENRVSEKLITMYLIKGLTHPSPGVGAKEYFKEFETLINSYILHLENVNWKSLINRETL